MIGRTKRIRVALLPARRSRGLPRVSHAEDRQSQRPRRKKRIDRFSPLPGANTAAPLFYGQTEQTDVIEKFLGSNFICFA
ncbi:MAG: hypothetical protein AABN33_09810 [Acidobacteriota bacterium]